MLRPNKRERELTPKYSALKIGLNHSLDTPFSEEEETTQRTGGGMKKRVDSSPQFKSPSFRIT